MANYYNMYNGNQPFNDTIHLNGPAPLDDRDVFSSVDGLYFTHGDKNHPLFNRAYKGMQVVIFDGSASIFMILNDDTPYSANNTTVNVTAQNYLDYWAIFSGSEYKIVKADVANAGMFSTYKLAFKSPNMKEFQTLEDTAIDIPKDYVLKEVHQCKASYNKSTNAYTETSFPNDSKWATDKNPVYIHFIWQTKDSSIATSNTYLKVADVIKVDLTELNSSVNTLETHFKTVADPSISALERYFINIVDPSISALETHFNTVVDPSISAVESYIANTIDPSISSLERHFIDVVDPSISALETRFDTVVDPSVNKLENAVHDISIGNIKFTGGSTPENVKTLTEHGMLPANTSIGYLETQTISDILKMILFETAVPKETQSNTATIKWKSGSKYASYVDVGENYPTVDQIVQESKNAISKWTSKDGTVTGGSTNLNLYNSSVLYYSTNNTFDSSVDARTDYVYTEHKVSYGPNGYFCSVVDFKKGSDAVDSLGSTTNSEGTKYIAAYATKKKSTTLTFNGSYRYFSNANVVTTTDFNSSGTKSKEPSPATFRGSEDTNAQMSTFFASANKTFYLKWTSNYTKDTDKFYLYIPNNMSITSVGSANPMTTAYDCEVKCKQQETASMNNGFASHTFKKYLIIWDGGVLDLKVVVE